MESRQITRRFVVTALGSGIALAPVIARSAVSKASASAIGAPKTEEIATEEAPKAEIAGLLAPLTIGSKLAGCTLIEIGEIAQGALGLLFSDSSGQRFAVEICARDDDSPRSPAETAKFQLYVVNEGDGSLATIEEHGLAAMALASVLRKNERSTEAAGFLTLRERLARHAGEIIRPA